MDIKDTEEYKSTRALLNKITMKQETLQEVAERIIIESTIPYDFSNELIEIAKWQAERMYSEEEVEDVAWSAWYESQFQKPENRGEEGFIKWFEQFKKKQDDSYIKEQKERRKKLLNLIDELEEEKLQEEPKQETLEEAAENKFGLVDPILGKSDYRMGYESGLIDGAKWQQEDMIDKLEMHILINEDDWNRNPQAQFRNFIEQFKKK